MRRCVHDLPIGDFGCACVCRIAILVVDATLTCGRVEAEAVPKNTEQATDVSGDGWISSVIKNGSPRKLESRPRFAHSLAYQLTRPSMPHAARSWASVGWNTTSSSSSAACSVPSPSDMVYDKFWDAVDSGLLMSG